MGVGRYVGDIWGLHMFGWGLDMWAGVGKYVGVGW